MSLRILTVAHGHPELSAGGAEIAAHLLFRGLRQAGDVVAHFLAWSDDPAGAPATHLAPFRDRPDETLLHAREFDRFLFSQPSSSALEAFLRLVERIDPDVIHFHHYTNIGLELVTGARRLKPGIRIIVTLHEYLAICHHHGLMVKTRGSALCVAADDDSCAACFPGIRAADFARRRRHIRAHFDQVDLFVAPSDFLRQRYVAWGIPAWQIVVLENGIEPVAPPPPRPRRDGERRAVFGFFGQIHPFKGLIELMSAFEQLARQPAETVRDIRLVIHGAYLELNDPAYIAAFEELRAATAPRVDFRGPYDHGDQHRLMASVDWVVVPSIWWENAPLVIEEAFAHRRPVICSDIGGMREKVRPGKDGFHFPVGDSAALAELLVRLAADDAVWDGLQSTLRRPTAVAESVQNHLALYRDRTFAFSP